MVSPHYNNIYFTSPTQTDPLYNCLLMWIFHMSWRLIAPYQHILTSCITITTNKITPDFTVPNNAVVSPHYYKIDHTLKKLTDTICITRILNSEDTVSYSVVLNTAMISPQYTKIYCTLPTNTECLYKYDNMQDKLCFCCS